MNWKSAAFMSLALTVGSGSPAWAQWLAKTSEPDVFGTTKVLAFAQGLSGDGLVIQCNDKDELMLAFVMSSTPDENARISKTPEGIPATLLLKAGNGPILKFDARLTPWNKDHSGVVVSGRVPQTVTAIQAIGSATARIDVGVDILGAKQSESFGFIGSTAAMNTIIKNCKLSDISPSATGDDK